MRCRLSLSCTGRIDLNFRCDVNVKGVQPMCIYKSSARKMINVMYASENMDVAAFQAKAKMLLQSYRHVCWASYGAFQMGNDDEYCICDEEIDQALDYLMNFSPEEDRHLLERKLRALFDAKWLAELVESTMVQVREFPDTGELYFELLSKAYLTKFKYREYEVMEMMGLDRSTYYERKREALLVFALAFWGTILPKTISLIDQAFDDVEDAS